jgi:predicted enzyme related to lactoylglutathione lyase
MAPDLRTERKNDFLLSSGGLARAGVAPLPDRADAKPGWIGVVRVANIDETLARAVKLGGEVLVAPRPPAFESRFAIIADSTGGAVGLVEYVDNANPANRP